MNPPPQKKIKICMLLYNEYIDDYIIFVNSVLHAWIELYETCEHIVGKKERIGVNQTVEINNPWKTTFGFLKNWYERFIKCLPFFNNCLYGPSGQYLYNLTNMAATLLSENDTWALFLTFHEKVIVLSFSKQSLL